MHHAGSGYRNCVWNHLNSCWRKAPDFPRNSISGRVRDLAVGYQDRRRSRGGLPDLSRFLNEMNTSCIRAASLVRPTSRQQQTRRAHPRALRVCCWRLFCQAISRTSPSCWRTQAYRNRIRLALPCACCGPHRAGICTTSDPC